MDNVHGYAGAAITMFKDKLVEVYTGNSATTLQFSECSVEQKSVIRGYLRDAIGDGVVIECKVHGNMQNVLINVWSIVTIMELKGHGNISDIFIDEYKEQENQRKLKRLK